jgi:hypothetical protein
MQCEVTTFSLRCLASDVLQRCQTRNHHADNYLPHYTSPHFCLLYTFLSLYHLRVNKSYQRAYISQVKFYRAVGMQIRIVATLSIIHTSSYHSDKGKKK